MRSVQITDNIKSALADFFSSQQYSSVFILVDENTEEHCLSLLKDSIPFHWVAKIASGETNKTIVTCEQIWTSMTEARLDRKALMINLGGGVIGDMGGFCAATYKRGIDFVNIPTTLLSQVDASVGGKLGIDFRGFKNHIGLFQDPVSVIIDPIFLSTLPEQELRSGFAEVIKHALIADAEYLAILTSSSLADQPWIDHIRHSVKIKSAIVENDPKEAGLRKILNFGHTIGHGIETTYLETSTRLLHGEAVAVGMICELYLSNKLVGFSAKQQMEAIDFMMKTYRPLPIPKNDFETIMENILQDKKNEQGVVKMSLLAEIGDCKFDIPVSAQDIVDSLFYFNTLAKA